LANATLEMYFHHLVLSGCVMTGTRVDTVSPSNAD